MGSEPTTLLPPSIHVNPTQAQPISSPSHRISIVPTPVPQAQVLYYAALALLESGHEAVYAAVERPLQFTQTTAIMEMCSA